MAHVDLNANTVLETASPKAGITKKTYAKGATVYERTISKAFDTPDYDVKDIGRSLDGRLLFSAQIGSVVSGVEYHFAGTLTHNGRTLARYTADGPEDIADATAFSGEKESITGFSSTLLIDPKTGIVRRLQIKRTTDHFTNGMATIETIYRFHKVGSTTVERPGWVETAIDQSG